jgi:IS30 family transposase
MLRKNLPKGCEITDDQAYLDLVAAELNNRPRRVLGHRTPAEVFTTSSPARLLPPAETANLDMPNY